MPGGDPAAPAEQLDDGLTGTRRMTAIVVRQAVLADLDELADLFDQYRQFQGKPADPSAAGDFLRARLERDESVVFMAHLGGQPAGFAQLYPSFSSVSLQRVYILNDLFVADAGRRQGVASRLLAAIEAHAWSQDAARITLNVARSNTAAQALYKAQGWEQDEQFFMFHRYSGA